MAIFKSALADPNGTVSREFVKNASAEVLQKIEEIEKEYNTSLSADRKSISDARRNWSKWTKMEVAFAVECWVFGLEQFFSTGKRGVSCG